MGGDAQKNATGQEAWSSVFLGFLAFFWLDLRTLTFLGFYISYNKEANSLTFRRGSEVSQGLLWRPWKFCCCLPLFVQIDSHSLGTDQGS